MDMSLPDLEGKIVLVTGATRGIGKAIAVALAEHKCHVVFNYRSGKEKEAQDLKEELLKLGAKEAHALLFDITSEGQMKDAIDSFAKDNGPITGLINNAGISKDQLMLRLKAQDLDDILGTNLRGAILLTSLLSRQFLKAENVSIVNISSIVGLMGNASQVAYAASKAGLIGMTKSLAKELASRKVRCNAVCPGFIKSDMTLQLDEKIQAGYLDQIPLKEFGEGKDVANLVCFLMSQTSRYITGEVIKIDGGLYI